MAFRILRVGLLNSFNKYHSITKVAENHVSTYAINLLKPQTPIIHNFRNTSFFNKRPAEQLWKGVTSVSNAGRKRGRGKGVARRKDLNKGQNIGEGKINIKFPGLNSPVIRGREIVKQERLPDDPEREKRIMSLRDSVRSFKRLKLSPIERGWTSAKPGGRKMGPPDPIGEEKFENFESWVLEFKKVSRATGNMGHKATHSAFMITGNGNGLAGFSLAKSNTGINAINVAKNRAGRKLIYVNRYDEHTVLHDFFCQFGNTKIFVKKMPKGFGLVCHRVIKCCCEAIGIKDLYAKVEGAKSNPQNIVKAFFIGLLQQKSFQEMADEQKMHVVELRKENSYFPTVVASPVELVKAENVESVEVLDFSRYLMGGKVVLNKKKPPPFYTKQYSWTIKLRKLERCRNHENVRLRMLAETGEVRSFLTDKYPEAVSKMWSKNLKQKEAE